MYYGIVSGNVSNALFGNDSDNVSGNVIDAKKRDFKNPITFNTFVIK